MVILVILVILVIVSLLLAFALALVGGLLKVLRDLVGDNVHEGPVFQDPGTMFHDQSPEHRAVRSQFAWQSRSHCRGPD
jgi:hypothetical protein